MLDDPTTQTPSEDQAPQQEDPGYTHEELQKDSIRDIVENTNTPKEEPKKEEEVKEPEKPEVDPAQVAEEAARKVLEAARKQEEEKPKEETKPAVEDEYLKWEEQFKKDNGKPPTYAEALKFVKDQAKSELKAEEAKEREEARKAEEAKIAEATKAREEEEKRVNTFVDDEIGDLYAQGKLTKIQDPNNPSDQGNLERRELFRVWGEVNAKRRAAGKPEIISATRIYHAVDEQGKPLYVKPNAQPAGVDAPISGNSSTSTTQSDQEYSYQEVHNKPFSFFRRR